MTFAIVDSSSGAACASAMNAAITSRRRGQDQHAAEDRADLVQPELEARRDAEVAAAPADRPEQVGVVVGIDAQQLAVGGHDLGGEQVVDRQAVLADEEADAAAERDAADPDRAGVAEAGGQAVLAGRRRCTRPRSARSRPRRSGRSTSISSARMSRQVEDDAALGDAVARGAVAAAADRQLEAGARAPCAIDARDVVRVRRPG